MKKFLLFFFLLPLFAKAQMSGATTQDEYNYITKGIADLAGKGLQQRTDYWFKAWQGQPLFTYQSTFGGNESYEFMFLMRQNDKKFCAVVMKVTKGNTITNYCIPGPNTEYAVITECRNDLLQLLGSGTDRAFSFLWTLLTQRIAGEYNYMQ